MSQDAGETTVKKTPPGLLPPAEGEPEQQQQQLEKPTSIDTVCDILRQAAETAKVSSYGLGQNLWEILEIEVCALLTQIRTQETISRTPQ